MPRDRASAACGGNDDDTAVDDDARGLLAQGWPADVVVFDPKTVGPGPLKRVYDMPAGADRLVSEASGIDAVIVNGKLIRRDGRDAIADNDKLPGRLLRHGRAA